MGARIDEVITVRVAENGRLSLPAKQRGLVGLGKGGLAVIRVEDGELRIKPIRAVARELQKLAVQYLGKPGNIVDEFLAERRKEAEEE